MSDINYLHVPVAGDVFDAADLNANLYSIPFPYTAASIHEVGNGQLAPSNFHADFRVQPHHVRSKQVGDAVSVGRVLPNDYFSDLWSGTGDGYIPVVGCAVTWYQKYDVTMANFHAGAFVSAWRQFGRTNSTPKTFLASPKIQLRTFFGSGTGIVTHRHSQRGLPQSVHFDTTSAAVHPVSDIATRENRVTRYFDFTHTRMVGGTAPCNRLNKGWHTFGLACYVPQNLFGQDGDNKDEDMTLRLNSGGVDPRPAAYYSAVHRLRMYVRNVTAYRLL